VSLPPDSPLTNGQRTFTVRLTRAGPQTLTVSSADGALTTTTNVAVSAAPATRLIVSTATPTPTAGTSLSFSVIAQDQFANTHLGARGTVVPCHGHAHGPVRQCRERLPGSGSLHIERPPADGRPTR